MNDLQLYLNNQLVDLMDDSPIALTFQINNLAEVKNQQGNTSNQFKLPLTQRNRQILGFPDDVAFTTNLPYDNYEARIIQDGLEILPYGIAQLNLIEQDTASITVLSGNVDFFDAIDGKIYDMGDSSTAIGQLNMFGPYEHQWNIQTIAYSQKNTEGWIWPVVDYGKIDADIITQPLQVDVRYLRPGFFLKTAIDLIVKAAGYKINPDSSLLKNALYNNLIVQFSNDTFKHGVDYQNKSNILSAIANNVTDQPINNNGKGPNTGVINFSKTNNSAQFQNSRYRADDTLTFTVEFNYDIQATNVTKGAGSEPYINVNIVKYSGGGSQTIGNMQHHATNPKKQPITYVKQKITVDDVVLQPGDHLGVEYNLWPGKERVKGLLYGNATLSITNKQTDVVYGQQVQCEQIFPDISQKDLLKDTLQHFGVICQTDNATRTVTLASLADIVKNIATAKNWTSKCVDQGKTISFQLGGYAQSNYLMYKDDDNVLPKGFANAQINIADKTLPATINLFESPFAPTLNRPYINGSIAQILKVDTSDDAGATDFSISTEPRLLINYQSDLLIIRKEVNFTNGTPGQDIRVNDIISAPYFYKTDGQYSLCYGDMPGSGASATIPGLKTNYYPELEKILKQTKKVVRYFLLTPRDILDLDLLIPVYLEQDSCYYYINKIDSWRKGQPVKVELVKLS